MLRYEASTVGKIRCFVPQHDSTGMGKTYKGLQPGSVRKENPVYRQAGL